MVGMDKVSCSGQLEEIGMSFSLAQTLIWGQIGLIHWIALISSVNL
jgi:hypothetical protein